MKIFKLDFTAFADYPGVGKVFDRDCVKYALKHLGFLDKLNPYKVGLAMLMSQMIKFGVVEKPKGKWIFK